MSTEYDQHYARYIKALHAMQSGVAAEMTYSEAAISPKHLRVGVNSALVETSALVQLLIAKGVFTREEHMNALATSMEAEVALYTKSLSELIGTPVVLG